MEYKNLYTNIDIDTSRIPQVGDTSIIKELLDIKSIRLLEIYQELQNIIPPKISIRFDF